MDAQERELRVGHRVDQGVAEVFRLRLEAVVFAAERDDSGRRLRAAQRGHPVGVQPGAVDHVRRDKIAGFAAHDHTLVSLGQSGDFRTGQDAVPALATRSASRSHTRRKSTMPAFGR